MDIKHEAPTKRWRELMVDFTQETTLHGIRYITGESKYLARRIVWIVALLTATAFFIYFTTTKLTLYYKYEKTVKVEVLYKQELEFPSVTICNLNQFHMRRLQQYGLIDTVDVLNSEPYTQDGEMVIQVEPGEHYYFSNTTCDVPEVKWKANFKGTRKMCAYLCSTLYNQKCASFLYSRDTCVLSSYTGDAIQECDYIEPEEFYLRTRYYEEGLKITCTFEWLNQESSLCYFESEMGEFDRDEWSLVQAETKELNDDVTLESGDGHYLLLAKTERRLGLKVSYTSQFISGESMCLSFCYRFLGQGARLRVLLRTTDLQEHLFVETGGSEPVVDDLTRSDFGGTYFFERLPDGEYQVKIEAKRSEEDSSGVAIDNLLIWPCDQIEMSCMYSKTGRDYTGTINKTSSGQHCESWSGITTSIIGLTQDNFPDRSVEDAKNYCRNPYGSMKSKPYCYYYSELGILSKEECDVPYCACLEEDMFQCTSGFCVPTQLTCNGVDDCGDSSDETSDCEEMKSVECGFDQEYMCGYYSDSKYPLQWTRHRHDLAAIYGSPGEDGIGSTIGYYIFVDSRLASDGDKAILYSPKVTLRKHTSIRVDIHANVTVKWDMSELSIYIASLDNRPLLKIYQTNQSLTDDLSPWSTVRLPCVFTPEGEYRLMFSATLGSKFHTRLGLDSVEIDTDMETCPDENTRITYEPKAHNCSGKGNSDCPLNMFTSNANLQWVTLPVDFVKEAIVSYTPTDLDLEDTLCQAVESRTRCVVSIYNTEGLLKSPNYPNEYPSDLDLQYRIVTGTNSSQGLRSAEITIRFLHVDIEHNMICFYDYLQLSILKGTEIVKLGKICNTTVDHPPVIAKADLVIIDFHTDDWYEKGGFVLHYSVSQSTDIEYTFALTNNIVSYDGDTSTKHFAELTTDELMIEKNVCLMFEYCIVGTLTVKQIMASNEEILWKVKTNKEAKRNIQQDTIWQTAGVNIPSSPTKMVLSFSTQFDLTDNVEGYAAFIKGIAFLDGQCIVKSTYNCNFEEDICGYKDRTRLNSYSSWRRIRTSRVGPYNNTDGTPLGDFVMEASIDGEPCILQSPVVTVQAQKCLSFNILCESNFQPTFILKIIDGSGNKFSNRLNFSQCQPSYSWITKYVNLPEGELTLQFFLHNTFFQESIYIDNVNISEGNCSISTDAQTFEKDLLPDFSMSFVMISPDSVDSGGAQSDDPGSSSVRFDFEVFNCSSSTYYEKHDINLRQVTLTEEIKLGNLAVMTKSYHNFSLTKLLEEVTHSKEDLILDCYWNNEHCNDKDFHPVHTEIGVCYSFNYDKENKQRLTSQTGSGSGLELILNIEEYEHLPGRETDAGIKVFLHTKEEIPYVKFLGAAVPPGMHSLVQIHPSKAIRLDVPYGNCSNVASPWYPEESYSHFKCQRGCHTESIINICNCRSSYMPGDEEVCSVADYIQCTYPQALRHESLAGCDCLEACKSYQYDTQVSYSRLSRLNVDLLLDKDRRVINENYNKALESSRVLDRDSLTKILQQMNDLLAYYKSYFDMVNHKIFDKVTSVLVLIKEAEQKMLTFAKEEIQDELFAGFPTMVGEYRSKTLSFWKAIQDSLQDLMGTLRSYHSILVSMNMTSFDTSSSWAFFIEEKLREEIPHVVNVLQMYTAHQGLLAPLREGNSKLPVTYIRNQETLKECNDKANELITNLQQIYSIMNEFNVSVNLSSSLFSTDELNSLPGKILVWEESATNGLGPCLMEYGNFLSETQVWIDLVVLQSGSLISRGDVAGDQWLETLGKDFTQLKDINTAFLAHHITQVQLHERLVSEELLDITYTNINNLNSHLDTDIFKPKLSELATIEERLISWYQEALNKSIIVGLYHAMDSSKKEHAARGIHLWRKPFLDLDSSELIVYLYNKGNIDKSWPKGKTLEQFYQSTSDFVIHTRIQAVIRTMKEEVMALQEELSNLRDDYLTQTRSLSSVLNAFVEDNNIDGEFVMNNFVQLNVFYGELKHSLVEEVPAYDIPTFFSELGGYLGLLLGASVMTVCELLDVILYNTFIKYKLKQLRKTRKIQVHEVETDSTAKQMLRMDKIR